MHVLRRSNLRPSTLPAFAVARPRLTRRIASDARVTVLAVPAGYGKSILVAQWAEDAGPIGWLTVDEQCADPAHGATHLLAALRAAVDGFDDPLLSALAQDRERHDEFVDAVLDRLEDVTAETRPVVIEDLDRAYGTLLSDDVARLVHDSALTFVLTARADPAFSLHRLRSRDELAELRAADLRFTPDETAALIERLSRRDLDERQLAVLVDTTEGWPVAVQLAALSLRNCDDVDEFLERFAGDDRAVADFLSNELFETARPDRRELLLDLAVLDLVHPELADTVTGRDDCAQILANLERQGFFLERVPEQAGWYRFHRLVREFLRHDLRDSDPSRAARCLLAAAAWHRERGDVDEAASYYERAEAWTELEDLIWTESTALWSRSDAATARSWITALPPAYRRDPIGLAVLESSLLASVGRPSSASAIVADHTFREALPPGARIVVNLLRAVAIEQNETPERVLEYLDDIDASLPDVLDDDLVQVLGLTSRVDIEAFSKLARVAAHLLEGDLATATRLERTRRVAARVAPFWQVHSLGTTATVHAYGGEIATASAQAHRAIELADELLQADHPARSQPLLALALAAYASNDLAGAATHIASLREIAKQWQRWSWYGLGTAVAADITTARGDAEQALRVLRQFRVLPAPPPLPLAATMLVAAEARAFLAAGELGAARQLLDEQVHGAPSTELAAVRAQLAAAEHDVGGIRKQLAHWPEVTDRRARLQRALWDAVATYVDGDRRGAIDLLGALADDAAIDGHMRVFLDAGPEALRLLRDTLRSRPTPFVRAVVDAAGERPRPLYIDLVDPLSARELDVLAYLPNRMTYAEIASEMFISVNTLKTHVRHICDKLGVSGRDAAVQRAAELGLL